MIHPARLTFALLLAGSSAALAQDNIDTDGDGLVSFAEVQAAYPDVTAEAFAEADGNGDGMLDETELSMAYGMGILPANY
ncbi:MAG: hypothetical protein KDK10_16490 [Maritimibacter sp.]|nr:hypothetical protein [Maritimibacter sp.]